MDCKGFPRKSMTMIGVSIAMNFTAESRNKCCSKLTNKKLERV